MPKCKKPRKPTQPYGYVAFAKTGRVTKHMFKLSDVKDIQEREVTEKFVQQIMTQYPDIKINVVDSLSEADQDFLLHTNHGKITLQVTEIPERDFTFRISEEEYKSRRHLASGGIRAWKPNRRHKHFYMLLNSILVVIFVRRWMNWVRPSN